jgi:phage terminase large subunit-like protein
MVNIEGPSGLLNVLRRRRIPFEYRKAPKPMILFPSGAKIHTSGADTPDTCRGMNLTSALLDEVIKWKEPRRTWLEGIMPALRADIRPDHPRALITTTPKPIDLLRELAARKDGSVHMIRGSTFDNAANLSSYVLQELKLRYEGTTLGRQELYGELIEAMDGALFGRTDLDKYRVDDIPDNIVAIVVGVDPGATGEDDETGIVTVARDSASHMYVLGDSTVQGAGRMAAMAVWRTVLAYGADVAVVEDNVGKRWLVQVLQDAYVELRDHQGLFPAHSVPPIVTVDSKVGKSLRAQPVGMRLQQGKLHMVGHFEQLENQMVSFDPDTTRQSPDRVDAMVHAARHLMKGEKRRATLADPSQYQLALPENFYSVSHLRTGV